jgi:hypothetical protein
MPTLPRLSGYQPTHHAPVLDDVSGRRRRRMRLFGLGLGTVLLACLTVIAVGLPGGPQAPSTPRTGLGAGTSPRSASGSAGDGSSQPAPNPVILPPASPSPFPDRPPPGSGSATANVGGSPAPVATNQAGKTPPGRNRGSFTRPGSH